MTGLGSDPDISSDREEDWVTQAMAAGAIGQWSVDVRTGRVIASNVFRSMISWTSPEDMTEGDLLEAVHPEDRHDFIEKLADCFGSQQPFQLTHRLVVPRRGVLLVDTRGVAIANADNQPIRVAAVTVEVRSGPGHPPPS